MTLLLAAWSGRRGFDAGGIVAWLMIEGAVVRSK